MAKSPESVIAFPHSLSLVKAISILLGTLLIIELTSIYRPQKNKNNLPLLAEVNKTEKIKTNLINAQIKMNIER